MYELQTRFQRHVLVKGLDCLLVQGPNFSRARPCPQLNTLYNQIAGLAERTINLHIQSMLR
jgi:hypothetical protein